MVDFDNFIGLGRKGVHFKEIGFFHLTLQTPLYNLFSTVEKLTRFVFDFIK